MQFQHTYKANTTVRDRGDQAQMSFSPDLRRDPTYFRGELRQGVAFRDAISALHDVVTADLRWRPKDRTAYLEWAKTHYELDWQQIGVQRQEVAGRIQSLKEDLKTLQSRHDARWKPFYEARERFFQYCFAKERDLIFLFDPVITVHPDEVFFECFSRDESCYGRLSAGYDVFHRIEATACGTTNVDYSADLYQEFQKIRSYKRTQFEVDPSGFEVRTSGEADYKEVKIDLPDSWVRGFLQVSSAMSLPATRVELHPMDIHNLCWILRRRQEKHGPRSLRYHLDPGRPVRLVLEPWEQEVVCHRSIWTGESADASSQVIRVWGRRRLLLLERLIPIAQKVTVYLLGTGMPSFYVADLGDMSFTLGLSGWIRNDWAGAANFDLLAPRAQVDTWTQTRVFNALKETWQESPDRLSQRLGLDRSLVLGALGAYTQAGRAIYDLAKRVYRVRELSQDPLPLEQLRFANPREEAATRFLTAQAVRIQSSAVDSQGATLLQGEVRDRDRLLTPSLTVDRDERIIHADCGCNWHQQHKLFKGPCEHILALRMQHSRSGHQPF